jgi:hypothetical protein
MKNVLIFMAWSGLAYMPLFNLKTKCVYYIRQLLYRPTYADKSEHMTDSALADARGN